MADPSDATVPVLQSTPAETTPGHCTLRELTQTTCGIGTWLLRVIRSIVVEYTYTWQGKERNGKKFECILLSEDSSSYCMGVIKRTGNGSAAEQIFKSSVMKFQENSIWNMSRVTLAADKPQFISSPIKHVIDLAKTKVSPVLQSTSFPKVPTPPENLATVVRLPRQQKVDFLAIVQSVENKRTVTTSRGERSIVDVTLLDGSCLDNGKMAAITTAMFFPTTDAGKDALTKFQAQDQPIAFFGVLCSPDHGKVNVTLGPDSSWLPCTSGPKAEQLMELIKKDPKDHDTEEIAKQSTWVPQEARSFKSETAVLSCCAIVQGILNQTDSVTETLFQLNNVRICEPGCGENIKTNDGNRLFLPVRLLDFTGALNIRMREQAALQLSGYSAASELETACREACLRFPLLSSVRVLVRPKSTGASEHAVTSQTGPRSIGASEHADASQMDAVDTQAILVEATSQLWDAQHAPNASSNNLCSFLPHLPAPSSRMVVARMRDISIAPHSGMLVKMQDGTDLVADFVLVLLGAKDRSGGQQLGSGYRVITKNVMDCDIYDDGSDIQMTGHCVSICTMDNLVHYKMAPPKPGGIQYVLALVSGFVPASGPTAESIMIDMVESISADDVDDHKMILRKLRALAANTAFSATPTKRTTWSPSRSPFDAKKVRTLAKHPTDASLPDSARTE